MAGAPAPSTPLRVLNGGRPATRSLATANTATSMTTGPLRICNRLTPRRSGWLEKYQPNAAAPTMTVAMSNQKQVRSCPEVIRSGYVHMTATTRVPPMAIIIGVSAPPAMSVADTGPRSVITACPAYPMEISRPATP